jgi:tetratricopeptide (TPR) repeat protein
MGVVMPGEPTLLRVLLTGRHWQKFEAFEAQFRKAAAELAAKDDEPRLKIATVSRRQFERWYAGRIRTEPHPDSCRVLEHMFGYPIQHLLASAQHAPAVSGSGEHRRSPDSDAFTGLKSRHVAPARARTSAAASEWPLWFGVRLAHLMALADSWKGSAYQVDSLQELLHQELLMFDAAAPEGHDEVDALYAFSRRQALLTLAALPLTLGTSATATERTFSAASAEHFISRCAASLTACWHLLSGSDLTAADQILSSYLITLERAAHEQSSHQKSAARLASQAHRICGIIALHHEKLRIREHHCKRALYYAAMASDAGSQASALISLASTYFYNSDPERAAVVFEQALALRAEMPQLQLSRVHAELSVVYAQLRREQDAIGAAELAGQLYPEHPEQDRSYLYAEFTPASLALEQGLAYAALAECYTSRRYQQKAAGIFRRVEEMTSGVPDRIRFEVINHQASTAILLDDLDAFEGYMGRALDGVTLLGSRQREREIRAALQRAAEAWPGERRLKAVGESLQIAAGHSAGELA